MGIQAVRVWTESGWLVLASDAAHLYANLEDVRPFPIVFNVQEMVDGFTKLRGLAETPAHVIPGHDPLVMSRYPCPKAGARRDRGPPGPGARRGDGTGRPAPRALDPLYRQPDGGCPSPA